MDTQDSVLNILSKEPFVFLNRIDKISPKNYCVKDALKKPIVILEDIGNDNFGLLSSIREKKNHTNDNDSTKPLFINKTGNIEEQENHGNYERIMEIAPEQDERLSERDLKLNIANNDALPTLSKEFSPLIANSNLSNAEISSKLQVNLYTEDLLKNVKKNIDYDAAITKRNNNFDSLTLKRICMKFKATVQIVRVSEKLRTSTSLSRKSYTKKVCNLDHNKFKRCLFNANLCNADVFNKKLLSNYESNGHNLRDVDKVSNEKRKISEVKYAETKGSMVSDLNTVHSNSQNDTSNIFSAISVECEQPIIDKIPTIDLKRLRLDYEKTCCDEKKSNRFTKECSPIKNATSLSGLFSNHKPVPSKIENDLESRFTPKSVALKQPCTNKINTIERKRVRFEVEKFNCNMNYDLKESSGIRPFIDKTPTVVLKRIKINTTECEKIKQDIFNVNLNHTKTNGVLVSDSKTVHSKSQNELKNKSPNNFNACKQLFTDKKPAVNLRLLRFNDETLKSNRESQVFTTSDQINSHLSTTNSNKSICKNQGRKEKNCKEVRIIVKRLKGDIIKKHLSMLSHQRNINNNGNMDMQKSHKSLQSRNSKLQCFSPTKNSLMFSVLQYSINHNNILSNFKDKSGKNNFNSSVSLKKKKGGRNGYGLNTAFKVFCTLQLSYNIHKVNALNTRY